jgi:streptogramin lyase
MLALRRFAALTTLPVFVLSGCAPGSVRSVPAVPSIAAPTHVIPAKRGKVSLYDDPYGDPTPAGITAGPDGALWFSDPGNDTVGRITTSGQYTLDQRAGTEVSDGIVTGPDKNLWFTLELEYGGIGRITPAGVVTLFEDPGGEYPAGITVGPDGALWFAEFNGTVGRMTTKGKVTHFTVAPSDAELQGIVTGPDGNLWVTQEVVAGSRFSDQVIRVSTSGKFKSFKVGKGEFAAGPDQICVGPDEALWFTEVDDNAIGRLTTTGKFKQFSIPDKYGSPSGIATGPDGALWFTESPGEIGRMTTSGKMKFYSVPGSDPSLQQITAGPDGAMWFTSVFGPSAIGRVTTR